LALAEPEADQIPAVTDLIRYSAPLRQLAAVVVAEPVRMAARVAALVITTCREDLEIRRAFLRLKEIMEVPTLVPDMVPVVEVVERLLLVNLPAQ
jgi:hypothetical protein